MLGPNVAEKLAHKTYTLQYLGYYYMAVLKSINLQYCKFCKYYLVDCFHSYLHFNIIQWVTGPNDSLTKHLILQVLFFFITSYRFRTLLTLYLYFCKVIKNVKINWKDFCREFCKTLWKKIILGTSDAWLTRHLAHQPSNPAYYIENWLISTPGTL